MSLARLTQRRRAAEGRLAHRDHRHAADRVGAALDQVGHEHVGHEVHRGRGVLQRVQQLLDARLRRHRQRQVDQLDAVLLDEARRSRSMRPSMRWRPRPWMPVRACGRRRSPPARCRRSAPSTAGRPASRPARSCPPPPRAAAGPAAGPACGAAWRSAQCAASCAAGANHSQFTTTSREKSSM